MQYGASSAWRDFHRPGAAWPLRAAGAAKRRKDVPELQIESGLIRYETFGQRPALNRRAGSSDMRHAWTLSTCFEHFGAMRSRRHFGGSAISNDGGTVVVAMWEDEIVREDGRFTYQSRFGPTLRGKSHGVSVQWVTHIKWALAHCDGWVRVVILTAEDVEANPRIIRSCYPDDALMMQITHFDAKTGFFEARTR